MAANVKFYSQTYKFLEAYNSQGSTIRVSLLNAIKRIGKKDYFGIPLTGYAWIIFKSSPHFGVSHGFKLLDALRNQKYEEFANTLDDLFTKFWKSTLDRENMEQEVKKVASGELEHPSFVSNEDHAELNKIESLPEGIYQKQAFENFVGPRMEQFHTPQALTPTLVNTPGVKVEAEHPADTLAVENVESQPISSTPTVPPPEVHTLQDVESKVKEELSPSIPSEKPPSPYTPNIHLRGEESAVQTAKHLGGEKEEQFLAQPMQTSPQPVNLPSKPSLPTSILKSSVVPKARFQGFQLKSIFKPLSSIRLPTNISVGIKKFISRNLTPLRIASFFTGGLGAIVGFGATNTAFGAAGGALVGGSIPTLVKQKGFGELVLGGVTRAGNSGASFISGVSGGSFGGRSVAGRSFIRGAGGVGKKWALLSLLGFVFLSAFLVGFAPAPETPGGPISTDSGKLTGASCPDQATIDANKKDPNSCKYLGVAVNLFDTNFPQSAIDSYINKYGSIFVNAGKGDLGQFRTRVIYIVEKSKEVGINPVLGLGYWKTESNFSTIGNRDLGCSTDAINFYEQVDCKLGINDFSNPVKNPITNCARSKDAESVACRTLKGIRRNLDLTNPIKYPIGTFDDFAEAYGSRDPNLDCTPEGCKVNNNCVSTYNKLVEIAIELNVCKVATPTPTISSPVGSSNQVATCPLSQDGSGNFNITCGSFKTPGSNRCGHGDGGYPAVCKSPPYASCPGGDYSPQLKAAIDVRPAGSNGNNSPVYLPFINGNQTVDWTLVSGPITLNGGAWGIKLEYTASLSGKQYRLDLTHLDPNFNISASRSGDKVGSLLACLDKNRDGSCEGGHLHTAVSIDGIWIDAIKEAHMCSP